MHTLLTKNKITVHTEIWLETIYFSWIHGMKILQLKLMSKYGNIDKMKYPQKCSNYYL